MATVAGVTGGDAPVGKKAAERATPFTGGEMRRWLLRLFGLWLAGAVGIVMLYLLIANVMIPTLQEDMAKPQIFAYRGWQSTGVRLEANQRADIRSSGQWLYTPGEWHGADGHRIYPAPSFYPMPYVAGGVLLGRVGDNGYVQEIGARGTLWSSEPGIIYLRINDDVLSDNEGSLKVSIKVYAAEDEQTENGAENGKEEGGY